MKTRRARRREHFARLLGPQPRRGLIPYHRRLQLEPLEHRHLLSGSPPVAVDDAYTTGQDTPLVVDWPGPAELEVFFDDFESGANAGWSDTSTDVTPAGGRGFLGQFARGEVSLTLDQLPEHPQARVEFDLYIIRSWDGNGGADIWSLQADDQPLLTTTFANISYNQAYPDEYPGGNHPPRTGAVESNTLGYGYFGDTVYHLDFEFDHSGETLDLVFAAGGPGLEDVSNEAWGLDNVRVTVGGMTGGLLGNDSDPEGDTLVAAVGSGPSNGTLTLNPDGTFEYTPDAGFHGVDTFTYLANDGTADSNAATVTFTVNDAPVAAEEFYVADWNAALNVSADDGVLANDGDPNGDALEAVLGDLPAHGTLALAADGSFTYTPETGFHGTDTFTYRASDGTVSSEVATVTLRVNAPPIAVDDAYTTGQDTPLVLVRPDPLETQVLFDDFESGVSDGWSSTATDMTPVGNRTYLGQFANTQIALSLDSLPAHDNVLVELDLYILGSWDGNKPDSGIDHWSLSVADGPILLDTTFSNRGATQSFPDNYPDGDYPETTGATEVDTLGDPRTGGDAVYHLTYSFRHSALELQLLLRGWGLESGNYETWGLDNVRVVARRDDPGVLGNDTDSDGDALTATVVSGPSNGTLTLNADGTFEYVPAPGYSGVDTFTYVANDGLADSNEATVTIMVNDPPVGRGDFYVAQRGTALNVPADDGVLANDHDPNGDPLEAILVDPPVHGSVTLAADGSFIFEPEDYYVGRDTFTYRAFDADAQSEVASVGIEVVVPESESRALDDFYSVGQGGALHAALVNGTFETGDLTGWTTFTTPGGSLGGAGFPDVVAFDTNGDGVQSESLQVLVGDGGGGILQTVNLSAGDVIPSVEVAAISPSANTEGGLFELLVDGAVVASHDFGSVVADVAEHAVLSATVSDVAPGEHEIRVRVTRSGPSEFGTTPLGYVDNVMIHGAAASVLANDADGPLLESLLATFPEHGDIEFREDGSFVYTPEPGFVGEDTFTYRAVEPGDGLTLYAIDHVNDKLVKIDSGTGDVTIVGAIDHDMKSNDMAYHDGLLYALTGGSGSFELVTIDPTTGHKIDVVPITKSGTPYTIVACITVVDGSLYVGHAEGTTAVQILDRLDPETGVLQPLVNYRTLDGGFNHYFDTFATDRSENIIGMRRAEEAYISYYLGFDPPSISGAGTVWPPQPSATDATFAGMEYFVLNPWSESLVGYKPYESSYTKICRSVPITVLGDSLGGMAYAPDFETNDATVTIIVTEPGAPAADDDAYGTMQDTGLTVPVAEGLLVNDSDPQGDGIEAVLRQGPEHGTLELAADGSFVYMPETGFYGTDHFVYQADDGQHASNFAAVTIEVEMGPQPPAAADDGYGTDQAIALVVPVEEGVLANDSDPNGDDLTAVLVDDVQHGMLDLAADGSFTYAPAADFFGTDTFTYRAFDGALESDVATVTIDVNGVPVAVDDAYVVEIDHTLTAGQRLVVKNLSTGIDDAGGQKLAHGTLDTDYVIGPGGTGASIGVTPQVYRSGLPVDYIGDGGSADSAWLGLGSLDASPGTYFFDVEVDLTGYDPATAEILGLTYSADNQLLAVYVNDTEVFTEPTGSHTQFTSMHSIGDVGLGAFQEGLNTIRFEVNNLDIRVNAMAFRVEGAVEAQTAAQSVLANDSDPEGDELTVLLVDGPAHGTLALEPDGTFTYTPENAFVGTDTFTYRATDSSVESQVATVTVTVEASPQGTISGMVFEDQDVDAVFDPGEPGMEGWTVELRRVGRDGELIETFLNPTPGNNDQFGNSVAGGGDGILVGALYDDTGAVDAGAAYLFDGAGNLLKTIPNPTPGNNDRFGLPVLAFGDDVLIGAWGDDTQGTDAGAVYLFDGSSGNLLQTFTKPAPAAGASFGVSLATEGDDLLVGARFDNASGTDAGAAYLFAGSTGDLLETFLNPAPDSGDNFGWSVALSGETVVVGAHLDDTEVTNGGAVYLFEASGELLGTLLSPSPTSEGSFGYAVAAVGDTIAVGAPHDDTNVTDAGAVYLFDVTTGGLLRTLVSPTPTTGGSFGRSLATLDGNLLVGARWSDTFGTDAGAAYLFDPDTGTLLQTFDNPSPASGDRFGDSVAAWGADVLVGACADDTAGSNAGAVYLFRGPAAPVFATTDSFGNYSFDGLEPGEYQVRLVSQEGYAQALPSGDGYYTITLGDGGVALDKDFGVFQNAVPVAADDQYETDEDQALSIEAPGVLGNDTDGNGQTVSAVLPVGPEHGTVALEGDGSFTYTPQGDFFGTDTFTYVANDGFDDSNVATVTITVNPVEDVPVAVDDEYVAAQGSSLAVAATEEGVLANDSDADGDALAAVLVEGPSHGDLTLNDDGTFEYTPDAGFSGEDSFTYVANDGDQDSNVATVTITVAPDETVPVGELSYPAAGAVIDEDLGYVDVRWTDPGSPSAGIDAATIDTGDITVQSGPRTLSVDRVVDQGGGVWRYYYADDADELVAGLATVTLVAGEVADRAGNVNVEATGTFTFEPPPLAQLVWGEDGAGNPNQVTAIGGMPLSFTVRYTTNDDNPALTGLGMRMHFDSSLLTLDGLTDVLAGLVTDPQVVADTSDYDGDPATDTFVLISWADVNENWPGGTLPADLFVANFTAALAPDGTMTPVKFTRVSTASGYGLDATPVAVTIQSGTLDVDDNGEADALSDGIVMLRYLFGFTGSALVQGALATDAERTDPVEIVEFLNNCRDTMLDVDANGEADALTDGILILRYLFGFTDGPLVAGALATDATRTDPGDIVAFLDQFNPGVQGNSAMAPLGDASVETASPSTPTDAKRVGAFWGESSRDGQSDDWLATDRARRTSLYRALAYDAVQSRGKAKKQANPGTGGVDLLMYQRRQ